jgi:hypothetical protein
VARAADRCRRPICCLSPATICLLCRAATDIRCLETPARPPHRRGQPRCIWPASSRSAGRYPRRVPARSPSHDARPTGAVGVAAAASDHLYAGISTQQAANDSAVRSGSRCRSYGRLWPCRKAKSSKPTTRTTAGPGAGSASIKRSSIIRDVAAAQPAGQARAGPSTQRQPDPAQRLVQHVRGAPIPVGQAAERDVLWGPWSAASSAARSPRPTRHGIRPCDRFRLHGSQGVRPWPRPYQVNAVDDGAEPSDPVNCPARPHRFAGSGPLRSSLPAQ